MLVYLYAFIWKYPFLEISTVVSVAVFLWGRGASVGTDFDDFDNKNSWIGPLQKHIYTIRIKIVCL